MGNINIKDEASVESWKSRAFDLNERAKTVIDHATQVLKDLSDMATGNFFNKVIEYADEVVIGVTRIMEGMGQILNVVNDIMSKAKRMIEDLASGVVDVVKNIVG